MFQKMASLQKKIIYLLFNYYYDYYSRIIIFKIKKNHIVPLYFAFKLESSKLHIFNKSF